jgi:hypothetical protein
LFERLERELEQLRAREDTITHAKRKAKGDARSARLPICRRLDY